MRGGDQLLVLPSGLQVLNRKSLFPSVFNQYDNARECITFRHNADCKKHLSVSGRIKAQHAFLTYCLFSEKHGQQLRQRLKESLPRSSKLASA